MTLRDAAERVLVALESEDELRHGEAVKERAIGYVGLGICAYCGEYWPCRTEQRQGPLRSLLRAALAAAPPPDETRIAEIAAGLEELGTGGTPAFIRGYNVGYDEGYEHGRSLLAIKPSGRG